MLDWKFVSPDLPHPNLAEEDGYSGDIVKISTASASTTTTRSRKLRSSSPAMMKVAATLGLESSSEGSEFEWGKCSLRRVRGIYSRGGKAARPRKMDERAPNPSHPSDMCHPRIEWWRSCYIMGE